MLSANAVLTALQQKSPVEGPTEMVVVSVVLLQKLVFSIQQHPVPTT